MWHNLVSQLIFFANRRGELVGYYTEGGGLTYLIVRNAGHMVPISQPLWAREIVTQVGGSSGFLPQVHRLNLQMISS